MLTRCLPLLLRRPRGAFALPRGLHSSPSPPQSLLPHLKRLSASDSEALSARVSSVVGEKNVSLAAAVRSQHGQDEGPDKGLRPDLVVFPGSTEEVSEVRNERTSVMLQATAA